MNFFNGDRDLRRYGSSKQGPEMPSQFSRKTSRRGVSYLFHFYIFLIDCLFLDATVLQRKRPECLPNFHKKLLDVVFLIFFIFTLFLSIVCFRHLFCLEKELGVTFVNSLPSRKCSKVQGTLFSPKTLLFSFSLLEFQDKANSTSQ